VYPKHENAKASIMPNGTTLKDVSPHIKTLQTKKMPKIMA
jgi:hypothetical protein